MSRTASSGTVLGDVVNSISYYIFDSRSKLVSCGVSAFKPGVDPIPDGFGTIRVKLMHGEYEVIIYALGKGRGYFNINGINDGLNAESHFLMADKEVFYFTDNMTVGTSTTDFNINLPRISSLLRINITDDLTLVLDMGNLYSCKCSTCNNAWIRHQGVGMLSTFYHCDKCGIEVNFENDDSRKCECGGELSDDTASIICPKCKAIEVCSKMMGSWD